jgi:CheY-like chemotaxis protein
MEAIGRLAGGIAHDFNNLLTVISGYSEIALARDDPVEIHRAIKEVATAAGSAAALTGQLLAFSRQQVLQPQVIDVSVVIERVEGLLGRLLGKDVVLTVAVQPDLRPITVDPSQIEQVLLNLAVNARDAMPDGGKLEIAVDDVDLAEADVVSSVGLEPGSYVSVTVSDTGEGMDEETIGRIFEPFFTTKSEGTGLGLATVHGIVVQSGGHISLTSAPGAGTTFRLLFPAAEGLADELQLPIAEITATGGGAGQTILVVEDEDPVRNLIGRVLSGHGYKVLAAASPEEAVEVAGGWTEPLHLIVRDVMLPGRSGPELSEKLRALHPEARALYTSGYASALVGEGVDPHEPFLAKPFTPTTLASKVREVLAA